MSKANKIMVDVMAQFLHDISNIVQNMMITSYERQIGGTSMSKIDNDLYNLKRSIEIYRSSFLNHIDYDKFEDIIENITFLYGNPIDFEENGIPDEAILEILVTYCIWMGKNEEISLFLFENKALISIKNSDNLKSYLESNGLRLKNIIDQLAKMNELIIYLSEDGLSICVEKKPFIKKNNGV